MHLSHRTIDTYRVVMAGMLAVLAIRIVMELAPSWHIIMGIFAVVAGVMLARIAAKHFGHHHHHAGDSAIDAIPVIVLLFANIAHPAIDGFSAVETFTRAGIIAGILYALSIVLHEVIRQSAFVAALEPLHIKWKWVVGSAIGGILLGMIGAFAGAAFFERYEVVADIATLFSYSFVIAEFAFVDVKHVAKHTRFLFLCGILLGLVLTFLMKLHGAL